MSPRDKKPVVDALDGKAIPERQERATRPKKSPIWVQVVAASSGAAVLIFFMALVVASILDREVPCGSRFLVVTVLALGAALAFTFIGGTMIAEGSIPLPRVQHPFKVAAQGGVAVLVAVLVLGTTLYVRSSECSGPAVRRVLRDVHLIGRTLDADSRPVPDAQITVEGYNFLAQSGSTGDFSGVLASIEAGEIVHVRVTHRDFVSQVLTIPVGSDRIALNDIKLVPSRK